MKLNYPPIKPIKPHASKAYADIVSHTNDVFRNSDIVTSAHESNHGLNSEIANSGGRHRDKNVGLYCLNNLAFALPEPKPLTIQKAAQKVPQEWRGGVLGLYQLYMVSQARSWGQRPFYLFDEFVCYTNGSIVAVEATQAGAYREQRWDSLHGAIYFSMFSLVTASMVPNLEDTTVEFIKMQLGRVDELVEVTKNIPNLFRQQNVDDWDKVQNSEFYKPFSGGKKLHNYGFRYI